jgi:predicted glycosyltransferase
LHPNYFKPNPAVLEEMGLSRDDNIFLLRFAAFDASHDVHSENFKKEYVPSLIKKLEKHGKIIISSEKKLDGYLEKYRYDLSPDKYHDILYYSKLYIGEGSTSAEEAAILGTPSLHFERLNINGMISCITPFIGILDELQGKYGLLYSYCNENELLDKVDETLSDIGSIKKQWAEKRDRLLRDKIDVTAFIVWLVENYPESSDKLKENPEIQRSFCKLLEEV